jgi:hypothetical protein
VRDARSDPALVTNTGGHAVNSVYNRFKGIIAAMDAADEAARAEGIQTSPLSARAKMVRYCERHEAKTELAKSKETLRELRESH